MVWLRVYSRPRFYGCGHRFLVHVHRARKLLKPEGHLQAFLNGRRRTKGVEAPPALGPDLEFHVALQRSAWRDHRNEASGRAGRYSSRDFGCRDHGERGPNAVEGDGRRSGQIRFQNCDRRAYAAGCGHSFDEWAEADRKTENSAMAICAPTGGHPVEVSVGTLHQPIEKRRAIKAIEAV